MEVWVIRLCVVKESATHGQAIALLMLYAGRGFKPIDFCIIQHLPGKILVKAHLAYNQQHI